MKKIRLAIALSALVALLALSPAAFAASSSQDGYGGDGGEAQTTVTDDSTSSLPFTGLDAGFVLGAGALMLAGGFGLRRVTARRDS